MAGLRVHHCLVMPMGMPQRPLGRRRSSRTNQAWAESRSRDLRA